MKRSEVNRAMVWAEQLLERNNIRLPHYAYWDIDQWAGNAGKLDTIRRVMLGWDITDFGSGKFDESLVTWHQLIRTQVACLDVLKARHSG